MHKVVNRLNKLLVFLVFPTFLYIFGTSLEKKKERILNKRTVKYVLSNIG